MKRLKKLFTVILSVLLLTLYAGASADDISEYAARIADGSFADDPGFTEEAYQSASAALNPQNIFAYMLDSIKSIFSGSHPQFLSLLAVILLSAVSEVFGTNLGSGRKIVDYVSLLSLMLICFGMTTPLIASVTRFLEQHISFMVSVSGTSSLLLAASGSTVSAASSAVSASFITAFTEVCAVHLILPAVKIIIVLSCVTALSKSLDLSGIISFLKSFCTYGTGLLFAVFLSVHSLSVNISQNADSIALRGIRFTFARLVPVAGGMMSESIKTVLAGMNMIRSAAGGIGIAYIIYTAIPTVFSVLAVKAVIICGMNFSRIFGTKQHTSFLEGLNQAYNLIFAVCIFAAFGGIIIFAVFMNTTLKI